MTEGLLCDRAPCIQLARLVFKAGSEVIEVCPGHKQWAVNRILEISGGQLMAIAMAHIAFRDACHKAVPVLRTDAPFT